MLLLMGSCHGPETRQIYVVGRVFGVKVHCITSQQNRDLTQQAPVVETMDSAIHRINRYPLDK